MARVSAYYVSQKADAHEAHREARVKLRAFYAQTRQRVVLVESIGLERIDDTSAQYACQLATDGAVDLDALVALGFDFEAGCEGA